MVEFPLFFVEESGFVEHVLFYGALLFDGLFVFPTEEPMVGLGVDILQGKALISRKSFVIPSPAQILVGFVPGFQPLTEFLAEQFPIGGGLF